MTTHAPLHELFTAPPLRSTSTARGTATAHFGELQGPLLRFIDHSKMIVGCVAWVTSQQTLQALSRVPVSLVVQKENWWKKTDSRGQSLARGYAALQGGVHAAWLPPPLAKRTAVLAPIACLGYSGAAGRFAPLMHHKFIVRCHLEGQKLIPEAVWTGSFNFSNNANASMENAVEIHDPLIAQGYLKEFALIASKAESMNWRAGKPAARPRLGVVFRPPKPRKKNTKKRRGKTGRRKK